MNDILEKRIETLEAQHRCYYLHRHVDGAGQEHFLLFQSPRGQQQFLLFQEFAYKASQQNVIDGALWLRVLNSFLVYPSLKEFSALADEDYLLPQSLLAPISEMVTAQQERLEAARKKA